MYISVGVVAWHWLVGVYKCGRGSMALVGRCICVGVVAWHWLVGVGMGVVAWHWLVCVGVVA